MENGLIHQQKVTILTSSNRRIVTYHKNKMKIRAFEPSHFQELERRLKVWAKMLGIKKEPTSVELKPLVEFLDKKFKDFGIDEVHEAFEKAVAGELDVDVEHYQSYDLIYVSKILIAYRKFRGKVLQEWDRQQTKKQVEQVMNAKSTDKELHDALVEFIKENKKIPTNWDWSGVYKHLEDTGDINYTLEEKKKFASQVTEDLNKQRTNASGKLEKVEYQDVVKVLEDRDLFAKECRKRILKDYLKKYL